jgi:thiol-disulfide isomerase/thioredoxin
MAFMPRCLVLAALAGLLALPVRAESERPPVGSVPPAIQGKDWQGREVDLSAHQDKVVIVTFWASWCGPCRRELPMLDAIRKTVGPEFLEVIAINQGETRQEFRGVLRANPGTQLTWVHDPRDVNGRNYGVKVLPNMFIIGRDGKVAARHLGYGEESVKRIVQEVIALLPPEALSRPAEAP